MILKSLFRRKVRTLLTTFGIAVGVAAVVALGALAHGLTTGYGDIAGGSGADLLVAQEDALDIVFSAIDQQIEPQLAGLSGVLESAGMIYTWAATESVPYFIVYGYDPASFAIEHFKITAGEPLSRRAARHGKPMILGASAADDLDKQVGDTLHLYETAFRIVGIYETGQPIEDGAAVILLEDAQTLSGKPDQVNSFLLKVRPGADIERLKTRIEQRFQNVTATRSSGFTEDQEMLKYVEGFSWGVSLIAIVIGGVGVMNTVLMSVFERTREFGVLRAVGWRPLRVLLMVLGESLGLSLLGGIVGSALGVLGVESVANVPGVSSFLPDSYPPTLFVQGIGVALGLGLVGGALPAWQAAQLLPAEAMRYDGSGRARVTKHVRSAALRNVLRQPTRTLLTVVGISVAIMAILLLGAMGDGVVEQFTGMAGGMGAHLLASEADASVDLSKIDQNVVRRISTLPGVHAAEGFLTGYTNLADLPFFIVFGYQPRGLAIREFTVMEGESIQGPRQIMLGRVAAENLNKDVGDTLRLFESLYKVVGIYETGVTFQDGGGVISLRDAQKLFGQPNKVSFFSVWLENPTQAEALIQRIEQQFPQVNISKASEFTEDLSDIEALRASTWGISVMALVVGGLGMTNTMVMSVFERTREIGVLRALGWRKRRVLGMIVRESVVLSMIGGLVGIALGLLLGAVLSQSSLVQSWIELKYSTGLFGQALLTAGLLGVVGGAYPAWRAANLQPIEALRYE
jgi:ABC-type antimicrobial peptide transport system permease subunit